MLKKMAKQAICPSLRTNDAHFSAPNYLIRISLPKGLPEPILKKKICWKIKEVCFFFFN